MCARHQLTVPPTTKVGLTLRMLQPGAIGGGMPTHSCIMSDTVWLLTYPCPAPVSGPGATSASAAR
jgi:hypothetical protein